MFREQEEKLLDIVRNGISDTSTRLDRLTQEISYDNIKLNALSKEADNLKLSLETSREITDNKFKEINHKLKNDKQQHGDEIDELWQENEYLRERLRDMEDRSRRDNLRIDGLKEVENETWEQTEQILKSMIQEKLEIEDANIERAHRVGNTNSTLPRTVIAKFSIFKGKQIVLSAAKKFKDIFRNFFRYRTKTSLNSLSRNFPMVVGHFLKILYNAASFLRCVSLLWSITR